MIRKVLAAITALLFIPIVVGGTQEDPEITDESGDAEHGFLDIVGVWFTSISDTHLEISMELVEAPPSPGVSPCADLPELGCAGAGVEFFYEVNFIPHDTTGEQVIADSATYRQSYAVAEFADHADAADNFWAFKVGHYEDGPTGSFLVEDAAISGRVEGNVITMVVPRSSAPVGVPDGGEGGGYTFQNLAAATSAVPRVGVGLLVPADNAASDEEFAFPLPPPPPSGPTYAALDEPTVSHSWVNQTSRDFVFNWTSPWSEVVFSHEATVSNGSARLVVLDAANETLLDVVLDENTTAEDILGPASPGNWSLRLNYSAFRGELSFSISEAEESGTETQTTTGTTTQTQADTGTDTGTDSGTSTNGTADPDAGEDSPALPAIVLVAALGIAVAIRRRW